MKALEDSIRCCTIQTRLEEQDRALCKKINDLARHGGCECCTSQSPKYGHSHPQAHESHYTVTRAEIHVGVPNAG